MGKIALVLEKRMGGHDLLMALVLEILPQKRMGGQDLLIALVLEMPLRLPSLPERTHRPRAGRLLKR